MITGVIHIDKLTILVDPQFDVVYFIKPPSNPVKMSYDDAVKLIEKVLEEKRNEPDNSN